MKELTFNEIQEVSGGFNWNGCDWLSPVDALSWGSSIGTGAGAAYGSTASGAAAVSGAMGAGFTGSTAVAGAGIGAAWGAAAGIAGFGGYNIGVGFNRIFGFCD